MMLAGMSGLSALFAETGGTGAMNTGICRVGQSWDCRQICPKGAKVRAIHAITLLPSHLEAFIRLNRFRQRNKYPTDLISCTCNH
jgi:hypothetical protein